MQSAAGKNENSSTAVAVPLPPIEMKTADGWVCVSRKRYGVPVPPFRYQYSYAHYEHQNDALDEYKALEDGEFFDWEPVAIFPARHGRPFGPEISPRMLALMLSERRAA